MGRVPFGALRMRYSPLWAERRWSGQTEQMQRRRGVTTAAGGDGAAGRPDGGCRWSPRRLGWSWPTSRKLQPASASLTPVKSAAQLSLAWYSAVDWRSYIWTSGKSRARLVRGRWTSPIPPIRGRYRSTLARGGQHGKRSNGSIGPIPVGTTGVPRDPRTRFPVSLPPPRLPSTIPRVPLTHSRVRAHTHTHTHTGWCRLGREAGIPHISSCIVRRAIALVAENETVLAGSPTSICATHAASRNIVITTPAVSRQLLEPGGQTDALGQFVQFCVKPPRPHCLFPNQRGRRMGVARSYAGSRAQPCVYWERERQVVSPTWSLPAGSLRKPTPTPYGNRGRQSGAGIGRAPSIVGGGRCRSPCHQFSGDI